MEKKALETEQTKASVADGVESAKVIDGAGEGGAFPEGQTNVTLQKESIRRLKISPHRKRGTNRSCCTTAVQVECESSQHPVHRK